MRLQVDRLTGDSERKEAQVCLPIFASGNFGLHSAMHLEMSSCWVLPCATRVADSCLNLHSLAYLVTFDKMASAQRLAVQSPFDFRLSTAASA